MSIYKTIRVPILKVNLHPIGKVKMAMCPQATYLEYLIRIYDGPYKPEKLNVSVAGEPKKMVDKEEKDYTAEDLASIMKDAKDRHLLHSSLDSVISNRLIGCKTTKEIWDTLEVKYQGSIAMKKNRKTILTQEYEHFDSKDDELLTEIYERFQKLLNDMSLVDKEYDAEDSNKKFLLALPKKWDLKVKSIRDNYDLEYTPLDEIYGMLKIHELEMEQKRKRKGSRSKGKVFKK